MTGLYTTTSVRRTNPVAAGAGILCSLLGAAVLTGYALRIPALITLAPHLPPMRLFNAAAILSGGLSLLALYKGWRLRAAIAAAVPAIAGIETLAEYFLRIPIQPWEMALLRSVGAAASASPRPSPLVGLCLATAGIALFLMAGTFAFRHRLAAVGLLGSLLAASSGVAFLSYVAGIDSAFAGGEFSRMAVHTAFAFLNFGAAIVRYAWHDATSRRTGAPSWLPFLIGASTLTVALSLHQAMLAEDRAQLERRIGFDATYLAADLETQLENRIQPLIRLARRRSLAGSVTAEEWKADVQGILNRGGYQAIQWVDASGKNVWATPPGAGDLLPDGTVAFEPRRGECFETARETRAVALTRPVDLVTGGKGFLACAPSFVNDELQGYAVGVFRYQLLFAGLLNLNVTSKYALSIYDGPERVYGPETGANSPWRRDIAVPCHNAALRMQLAAGENLVGEALSAVPGAILVAGCLLSVLFFAGTWLLQTVRPFGMQPAAVQAVGDLQALIESSVLPVVLYGQNGSVQGLNQAARDLFGTALPVRPSNEPFRILRLTVVRGNPAPAPEETLHAVRTLAESSSLPALAFDADGVFQSSNRAAAETLGWTTAVWQGRRVGWSQADARAPFQARCVLLIQGQAADAPTPESYLRNGSGGADTAPDRGRVMNEPLPGIGPVLPAS